jgi:hypothetical protein
MLGLVFSGRSLAVGCHRWCRVWLSPGESTTPAHPPAGNGTALAPMLGVRVVRDRAFETCPGSGRPGATPVAMHMPGRSAQGRFVGAVVRPKCSFNDGLEIVVRWVIDRLNSRSLFRKVRADRPLRVVDLDDQHDLGCSQPPYDSPASASRERRRVREESCGRVAPDGIKARVERSGPVQACACDCERAGCDAEPCKLRTPNSRRRVGQRRSELDVIRWARPEDPFAYEPLLVCRTSYGGGKLRPLRASASARTGWLSVGEAGDLQTRRRWVLGQPART